MLLRLGGESYLGREITPENRVDVVGEVLEKHRPVNGGYSLEKAFVHDVSVSSGPSTPEGGGRGGNETFGLLWLLVEVQPWQDRGLHRQSVRGAAPGRRTFRLR